MKQKFKKIFSSPKIAIAAALVIAIIIGATSYNIHKKTLTEISAKIAEIPMTESGDTLSSSPQDLILAFPISGRVENVSVKIGESVSTGQVLATLDQSNAQASLQSAQGSLAQAQANYAKVLAAATPQDVAVSQAAVEVASTTLSNAKQNLLNELGTAESNANTAVLSATNNLFSNPQSSSPQFGIAGTVQTNQQLVSNVNDERLGINLMLSLWQDEIAGQSSNGTELQMDQLNATATSAVGRSLSNLSTVSGYFADIVNILTSYSQSNSNTGQVALSSAQVAVTSAKTMVDSLSTAITNYSQAVRSAQSALDSANAALNLKQSPARSEDVTIASAQVTSAQGQVDMAQANLNNTVLRAPTNGIITQVDTKVGQQASANQEVMILQH
jgi:HlyD family secretion protein